MLKRPCGGGAGLVDDAAPAAVQPIDDRARRSSVVVELLLGVVFEQVIGVMGGAIDLSPRRLSAAADPSQAAMERPGAGT